MAKRAIVTVERGIVDLFGFEYTYHHCITLFAKSYTKIWMNATNTKVMDN